MVPRIVAAGWYVFWCLLACLFVCLCVGRNANGQRIRKQTECPTATSLIVQFSRSSCTEWKDVSHGILNAFWSQEKYFAFGKTN